MSGVIAGAHVKVFAGQRMRFLGAVYEDGSFGLVTAAEVEPIHLTIAGMAVPLPIRAHGRVTLEGRAKRDGVTGSLYGTGSVENWQPIPGVLRLDAGPVELRLTSDGRFAIRGDDARATLFNGAAVLNGHVNASETHVFVEGTLDYQVGGLTLAVSGRSRIGPGAAFELEGAGQLSIDGNSLLNVRGHITEQVASVEGTLELRDWRTPLGNLPCALSARIRGTVDLRKRVSPSFAFEGEGTLEVGGATVEGRAGIARTPAGRNAAFAEGRLRWQGRDWLNGRIELRDGTVTVSGRTSLAFDLTAPNFANVQVANLFFELDLEGRFTLNANGGLAAFAEVKGSWQLAVQLPGANSMQRQAFPIAMQSFNVGSGVTLNVKILEIRELKLLPTSITIPTPQIDVTSTTPLRFHRHGVNIPIPGIGDIVFALPELPGFHTPTREDPFPFPMNHPWDVIQIPTGFTARMGSTTIGLPSTGNFDVRLVWDEPSRRFDIRLPQA